MIADLHKDGVMNKAERMNANRTINGRRTPLDGTMALRLAEKLNVMTN